MLLNCRHSLSLAWSPFCLWACGQLSGILLLPYSSHFGFFWLPVIQQVLLHMASMLDILCSENVNHLNAMISVHNKRRMSYHSCSLPNHYLHDPSKEQCRLLPLTVSTIGNWPTERVGPPESLKAEVPVTLGFRWDSSLFSISMPSVLTAMTLMLKFWMLIRHLPV